MSSSVDASRYRRQASCPSHEHSGCRASDRYPTTLCACGTRPASLPRGSHEHRLDPHEDPTQPGLRRALFGMDGLPTRARQHDNAHAEKMGLLGRGAAGRSGARWHGHCNAPLDAPRSLRCWSRSPPSVYLGERLSDVSSVRSPQETPQRAAGTTAHPLRAEQGTLIPRIPLAQRAQTLPDAGREPGVGRSFSVWTNPGCGPTS